MHVVRPFTLPIDGWQQTLKHEVDWVNTHQSKLIGRPHYIVSHYSLNIFLITLVDYTHFISLFLLLMKTFGVCRLQEEMYVNIISM
jgi:hypothetical protein